MSGRWMALAGALALAVTPLLAGCGQTAHKSDRKPAATSVPQSVKHCQDQWHDVAESVLGLDQDTDPSSLASRWTTVIATVDYYETSTAQDNCQATIETQVEAIEALRAFSDRLRPYDMSYQVEQVSASVDLYLHDPVPAPTHGPNGGVIKAPTHAAVSTAFAILTREAEDANAELQPAWAHLASVSLDDHAAVTAALGDLDSLAQSGTHWTRCQQALQVIIAATRAQEGLLGTPEGSASGTPTPTS